MRTFIISTSLVLVLLAGPGWGGDDTGSQVVGKENAILFGCREFLNNTRLENAMAAYLRGECVGIVKGLDAAAIAAMTEHAAQTLEQENKSPDHESLPSQLFCSDMDTSKEIRAVVDYIDERGLASVSEMPIPLSSTSSGLNTRGSRRG